MYLVSLYWRGSLNVKEMRLKNTLEEVIQHLVDELDFKRDDFEKGFYRIYEVYPDRKPKLINLKPEQMPL